MAIYVINILFVNNYCIQKFLYGICLFFIDILIFCVFTFKQTIEM